MAAELDAGARERLLDALAAGESVTAAAKAAGYSRRHVYRLVEDPAFSAELERRRAVRSPEPDTADEALALAALRSVLEGELAEDRDRINAAKALLAHGLAKRKLPAKAAPPVEVRVLEGGQVGDEAAARAWRERQA